MNLRKEKSINIIYNFYEYGVSAKRFHPGCRSGLWDGWNREGSVSIVLVGTGGQKGRVSHTKREKMTNYNMKGATIIWSYLCKITHIGTCINTRMAVWLQAKCGHAVPCSRESKSGSEL